MQKMKFLGMLTSNHVLFDHVTHYTILIHFHCIIVLYAFITHYIIAYKITQKFV